MPERLDAHGQILTPLDEAAVAQVAAQLHHEGVEAVAVCLLHAYANLVHEWRIGALLADAWPGVLLSLSSEVAPEFGEYTPFLSRVAHLDRMAAKALFRTIAEQGRPTFARLFSYLPSTLAGGQYRTNFSASTAGAGAAIFSRLDNAFRPTL